MSFPNEFIAYYKCVSCTEEYEMYNCSVPYVKLWCDTCDTVRKFRWDKILHRSWHWDYIQDDD